ncbi:MAG: URC4/urg3 family protein [Hyphomicrobiaceae bacterium]
MSKAELLTTTDADCPTSRARSLLSAAAVRARCEEIFVASGDLTHFKVHLDRLDAAASYVVDTIRQRYPDLDIPFHARWRHFNIDGADRWRQIAAGLNVDDPERARIRFDLVVTSVLLDAGAGPHWRYRDAAAGGILERSEGLALASLDAFAAGFFSSDHANPLMADAPGLKAITPARLGAAFQVRHDNPLEGLEGRATLMNRLGATLLENQAYFPGDVPRIGSLFDKVLQDHGHAIDAAALLNLVLEALGPIWPGRVEISGVNLGDTWRHPAIVTDDETTGLVPFHKLSQWLTYSLIEPLEDAGVEVTGIDGLTGLAEYRNGGLFVDLGVLEVCDPAALQTPHSPGAEFVVEWRALTVALLDRIAVHIREELGHPGRTLPLASILEGGTWAAGRRIAADKRSNGQPPITIVSDGSVF